MEFTHEFTIPRDKDEALEVLTDLERVAPCMPGATLEEVDGNTYSGRVKVKVGPMSLTYAGDATVTEVDHDNHTARIEASGREKRGSGTASADVSASLVDADGGGTTVTVVTDLKITGKPAQFGRGVMADVGGAIIQRFADNLREQLEEEDAGGDAPADGAAAGADEGQDEGPDAATTTDTTTVDDGTPAGAVGTEEAAATTGGAPASASPATGPRKVQSRPPKDDALDILDVAGDTTTAKVVPIVAGVALVLLIIWLLTRDGDDD